MQRGGDLKVDDVVVPRIYPRLDTDGSMSTEEPGNVGKVAVELSGLACELSSFSGGDLI